jgi:hypothetical protein
LKKYPTLPINYPMLNKRTKKNTKSPMLPKKYPMMTIPYIEKLQTTLYWRPYIDTEKNVNVWYFPDNIGNIGP